MTLKIAISGSTGMIGKGVSAWFQQNGAVVTSLIRPQTKSSFVGDVIRWDIDAKTIETEKLEGYDAVIHFAGTNIAAQRWTDNYKEKIFDSRINSTRFLADTLAKLQHPPKVFFSASAVGYYGAHAFDVWVDESFISGNTFLAEICREWEEATKKAQEVGIRVVHMRTGMVLAGYGGALAKMMPIFKKGLGGKIGSGKQVISWIALEEIPLAIMHLINTPSVSGPVNFVTPKAVSNAEFTKILAKQIGKPAVFPLPAFMAKLMFGEMADDLLLSGARVVPKKLQESGYQFKYPDLSTALSAILK